MTKSEIQNIRDKADIVAVIGKTVPLTKKGKFYFGVCPFHHEKTPSFAVDPAKKHYHCFGCGEHGDVIEFLRKVRGLSFQEAVREAAASAGITIHLGGLPVWQTGPPRLTYPDEGTGSKPGTFTPEPVHIPNEAWRAHAGKFVEWAHKNLMDHAETRKYLASRGIGQDVIQKYRLGYNPGRKGKGLYKTAASWGFPKTAKTDLIKIPVGIVIPARRAGHLIRIRIRQSTGEPPYFVVRGSSGAAMILPAPKNRHSIWLIVESELDGCLCAGVQRAVHIAAMGSATAKPDAALHERLTKADAILLALDKDKAGVKAMRWWKKTYSRVILWPVPQGKDPGEAYAAGQNIRDWIRAGVEIKAGYPFKEPPREPTEAPEPSASQGGTAIPTAVRELAYLLKQNPGVEVLSMDGDVAVWRKDGTPVRGRIGELVYAVPEVTEYLRTHPAERIDWRNIIVGRR